MSRPTWTARCTQLESTDASGTISRGTVTRLTRPALSSRDEVPAPHARAKKLYGTRPHNINRPKCGMELLGNILVKMNVSTPMSTSGFNKDQKTPKDMLR